MESVILDGPVVVFYLAFSFLQREQLVSKLFLSILLELLLDLNYLFREFGCLIELVGLLAMQLLFLHGQQFLLFRRY
jgi:hypothetical protein